MARKPMLPKKPQAQKDHSQHNQPQQTNEETYQPLIPPKTYLKPTASSEYQDLTFERRSQQKSLDTAGSSEGQYEAVRRPEETNQYAPLTFGVSTGPQTDGVYQALTGRDESSHYQDLNSVRT